MRYVVVVLAVATLYGGLRLAGASPKFRDLDSLIDGDVYLPGDPEYVTGATMKSTNWNSNFVAVVMVNNEADVSKVMTFVRENRLRPTVKSSGHDYIGRSGGDNTLSINLSRMRNMRVDKSDSRSTTGASITVGPGLSWIDIYREVDKEGMVIVGGSAQSVSPGGYTLGGGHSPMSRALGLGVDNVISMTLVTAEGHIINVTENGGTVENVTGTQEPLNDPDLFWALLGGGGGTYGVVTSFTYVIHPPPSGFVHVFAAYPIKHPTFGDVGQTVMEHWNQFVLSGSLTEKWGGYVIVSNTKHPVDPFNPGGAKVEGTISLSLLHYGDWSEAGDSVEAVVAAIPSTYVLLKSVKNHTTFLSYEKDINDPTGFGTFIFNRLLQPADLKGSGFPSALLRMNDYHPLPLQCTWVLIGGKTSRPVAGRTSVNPAMRSAIVAMTCGTGWPAGATDSDNYIKHTRRYSKDLYDYGTGTYYNEPDYYLENWKKEYWGDLANYERLLRVKRRWDPFAVLMCHHCVGAAPGSVRMGVTMLAFVTMVTITMVTN